MKGTIARTTLAVLAVAALYAGGYEALRHQESEPAARETVEVEVGDPAAHPLVQEERKRLEAEREKQAEARRRLEQEKKRLAEREAEVASSLSKLKAMAEELAQKQTSQQDAREAVVKLEEKLDQAQAESARREEQIRRREEALEAREKEARVEREAIRKRQAALEKMAEALVEQQKDLAERSEDLTSEKEDVEAREKEVDALARTLIESQREIQAKQDALQKAQQDLSESQTERDREWKRIRDEWKKIEGQRKRLEEKLTSTEATAAEWESIKAEWKKLEAQKKKLEEAQEVHENVENFKKAFDKNAYREKLDGLKSEIGRKQVESDFISYKFFFATDDLRQSHIKFFGIRDMYLNLKTKRFVLVRDYARQGFEDEGVLDEGTRREIFSRFSTVTLNREGDAFYENYIDEAMGRIGRDRSEIRVLGLMPVDMVYEVVLHQKRVIELLGVGRDDVKLFQFAPWFDTSENQWRFKVIRVTVSNGRGTRVKEIGNYRF